MAEYREVNTTDNEGGTVRQTERVERTGADAPERPVTTERQEYRMSVAARFIWLVAGVIIGLLGIRFVLAALGANPANGFANFIYHVTHPLASPFFSLFNYDQTLGHSRFELGTLVAMAVYALVAWVLVRLVTLGSRKQV